MSVIAGSGHETLAKASEYPRKSRQIVLVDVLVFLLVSPDCSCRINYIASCFVSGPGSHSQSDVWRDTLPQFAIHLESAGRVKLG